MIPHVGDPPVKYCRPVDNAPVRFVHIYEVDANGLRTKSHTGHSELRLCRHISMCLSLVQTSECPMDTRGRHRRRRNLSSEPQGKYLNCIRARCWTDQRGIMLSGKTPRESLKADSKSGHRKLGRSKALIEWISVSHVSRQASNSRVESASASGSRRVVSSCR